MYDEVESARGKCTSFAWGVLKISLFGMTPLLLYLMSYGFYLRTTRAETLEIVYRPAKWMLTDTLLQKPVLLCGSLCGSEQKMSIVIEKEVLKNRIQKHLEFRQKLQEQSSTVICDVPTSSIKQNVDHE